MVKETPLEERIGERIVNNLRKTLFSPRATGEFDFIADLSEDKEKYRYNPSDKDSQRHAYEELKSWREQGKIKDSTFIKNAYILLVDGLKISGEERENLNEIYHSMDKDILNKQKVAGFLDLEKGQNLTEGF